MKEDFFKGVEERRIYLQAILNGHKESHSKTIIDPETGEEVKNQPDGSNLNEEFEKSREVPV